MVIINDDDGIDKSEITRSDIWRLRPLLFLNTIPI